MRNWSDFSDKNVTFLTSFKISASVQMECRSLELDSSEEGRNFELAKFLFKSCQEGKRLNCSKLFFLQKGIEKN